MSAKYWADSHRTLYLGDCRDMSELADESVHCVVTSPPYWGLRKYAGVPDLVFGENNCQHEWQSQIKKGISGGKDNPFADKLKIKGVENYQEVSDSVSAFCLKCNAWRGQLGQEPTPELYIQHIVDIFKEVKRVLRSDGCVFINIGDSYNSGEVGRQDKSKYGGKNKLEDLRGGIRNHPVIKIQDKCLIPFRLAIALQEDGWFIRQDIIWQKPNPMPESVSSPRWVKHRIKIKKATKGKMGDPLETGITNRHFEKDLAKWKDCPGCPKCLPNDGLVLRKGSWRPTRSHEYILMLTKTNDYYCDGEAVREPMKPWILARKDGMMTAPKCNLQRVKGKPEQSTKFYDELKGANLRSIWTFSTQSYGGNHYATFPKKLPELCIKAGTSEYGVCAECGKPWARILKQNKTDTRPGLDTLKAKSGSDSDPNQALHQSELSQFRQEISYQTLGWKATCKCKTDKVVPATVLDPFCGTGTTLLVAGKLGRRSVGYELSEDYCKLSVERLKQQVLI